MRIAEDLSRRFDLPLAGYRDQVWVLHEYVASLISRKQLNPDKIRPAVASALATLTRACDIPKPLAQLAAIEDFKLFVSLSCDDLLLRALRTVAARAEAYAYGIRSETNGRAVDLPDKWAGKIS